MISNNCKCVRQIDKACNKFYYKERKREMNKTKWKIYVEDFSIKSSFLFLLILILSFYFKTNHETKRIFNFRCFLLLKIFKQISIKSRHMFPASHTLEYYSMCNFLFYFRITNKHQQHANVCSYCYKILLLGTFHCSWGLNILVPTVKLSSQHQICRSKWK